MSSAYCKHISNLIDLLIHSQYGQLKAGYGDFFLLVYIGVVTFNVLLSNSNLMPVLGGSLKRSFMFYYDSSEFFLKTKINEKKKIMKSLSYVFFTFQASMSSIDPGLDGFFKVLSTSQSFLSKS